ncbi:OsmC family protein [Rhodocista pekingensis]|uniref:OsmC family protein n=1 Tax=Rhodocista pekingensis TaxID=201185 RepID=A0ABW2L1F7_9PROT
MQALPHIYLTKATGTAQGNVRLEAEADVPALDTAAPPQFGGPNGFWSPETLFVGAVADCYILTFRAIARASKLEWESLEVDVEGVLDRVEGVTRFTRFTVKPRLLVKAEADAERATTLLAKAERTCLITNSLNAELHLEPSVGVAA